MQVQWYVIYQFFNARILGTHLKFFTNRDEWSKKHWRPLISRDSWLAPSAASHGKFQAASSGAEGKGNNYSEAPMI